MKNQILVINGHSNKKSFCGALAEGYAQGARAAGLEAHILHLSDLNFDPILHMGYSRIQDLEPDLVAAQQKILDSAHLVLVYPVWWSSAPALLKGFIDRIFLPGFAFKYHEKSPLWDRLLKGRTAEMILTTDAPNWWNTWVLWNPAIRSIKKGVLEFSGYKVLRVTSFDQIKYRTSEQLANTLKKAEALGKKAPSHGGH